MSVDTHGPVNLISLDDPNITGVIANSMRLTRHASRMGDKRNVNRTLVGEP
jgi:hypothetical protein